MKVQSEGLPSMDAPLLPLVDLFLSRLLAGKSKKSLSGVSTNSDLPEMEVAGLSQICFVHAIQAKSFLEPENWLLGKPTQVPCRGCQIECSISSQVRGG